jgi:rubrerythrin
MENPMSVNEILDFAIGEEESAAAFYEGMADRAAHRHMKDVFLQFAEEEKSHRKKLQAVKDGKTFEPAEGELMDLKISDYVADVSTNEVESYEDALVVAMKKEKAAFRLYSRLSEMVDNLDTRRLFLALAQEEAKHKLRFEIEYDESIREN